MSFINVFGGGTLQPTDVSYRAIALATNTTLVWPINSVTGVDYVARVNDVTPAGAGLTITMPPANQISTGFDMLFRNLGASSFNVLDNGGNVILTVAAGTMQLLYLTSNTTVNGAWGSITFGAGSAAINVASVAGLGLIASGAQLMSAITTSVVSAGPVAIDNTYRAAALIWTGGTGTFNLQQVATATDTFWMEVRNQGTGSLTIAAAASEFIDGTSTIVLQPTESCFIHAGVSANWYTVGRGRSTSFEFTELVKTVTGGTVTLSLTEAANVVQKYQGTLLSNQIVVLPPVVQVYYVQNSTAGAFTLTFESPTPGTVVTVPSGQNAILFCDGTNVINTSTTVTGITSLLLNQGTVTSPAIGFVGNSVTGIYQPLTNTVAVTCNGVEVARFTAAGINGVLGGTTPAAVNATTISASGQIQSTLATGTAPFVVASTTPVANLSIGGNAATATIATIATTATNLSGGSVSATTVSATGQIQSTLATGTAPFVVASTTPVANLSIGGNAATATNSTNLGGIAASGYARSGANADITSLTILSSINSGPLAGLKNRVINGDRQFDQRNEGASLVITAGAGRIATCDRFYAVAIGGNATYQRITGTAPDLFVEQLTGGAGVTNLYSGTYIESANIADLAGTTVNLSCDIANSLLTTVNWSAYYPNAKDNLAALTSIASGSFTVTSTLAKYGVSIALPAGVANGLLIELGVGAQISGTWQMSLTQVLPGATTPTYYERLPKPFAKSLCQAYYRKTYTEGVVPGTVTNVGAQVMCATGTSAFYASGTYGYGTPMRGLPNITFYSPVTGATGNWRRSAGVADVAVIVSANAGISTESASYTNNAAVTVSEQIYGHIVANAEFY